MARLFTANKIMVENYDRWRHSRLVRCNPTELPEGNDQ